MQDDSTLNLTDGAAASQVADHLRQRLQHFLTPLLAELDAQIDRRLVGTFLATIAVFLLFRHRAHGLLLSELGAYLLSPQQAPAGTKRLSNLLRCPKWHPSLIARFLWQAAHRRVAQLHQAGEESILLWHQSVLEKPETHAADGLGSVRSSKAARLLRIRPGFYRPPTGRPVFVPGMRWLCLLVIGLAGPPTVAAMRWFSTGKRGREVPTPLYRLRSALSRLWLAYPATQPSPLQTPG
jgi:hypothetical protein